MLKITQRPKFIVLCILDGWGVAAEARGNAITLANPVNFNHFWRSFPHTLLASTGQSVGLPKGHVGNSEVGHQNIGAGRVVFQDVLRISLAIDNGSFFKNPALDAAVQNAKSNNSNIHLIGLVSQGSVHSYIDHFFALLKLFKHVQIPASLVKIHMIVDGRDSPPTSAKIFLSRVIQRINTENLGQVASLCGRYWAMDRDNRWDRTQKAYNLFLGIAEVKATEPIRAIEESYSAGVTDEFVKPTLIVTSDNQPPAVIRENDSIIFFNYRPDRMRQLVKTFVLDDLGQIKTPSGETVHTFDRGPKISQLFTVTLTQYESHLPVSAVAFGPNQVKMPLARVLSERKLRQLHIAETEKFAHVTYFFNGGREQPFDNEDRLLINSPKVASYDQMPQMATEKITQTILDRLAGYRYNFIVVNFSNADMVGHTGNLQATIEGIQTIDQNLGILVKTVLARSGALIITADHGNAEQMINPQTGQIDTEHNSNPAPCIIIANDLHAKHIQLKRGILADIAPTILSMLNIPKPSAMTGRNLLE